MRYLTDLSFDVLHFSLVEALAVDRERLQPGGTGIRLWLKSLATYSGNLFRKHSIELSGLLKYMFCQLVTGSIQDLIVLQELVGQMSGVKPLDDATDSQLEALAGGETLRREALFFETARFTKKAASRLLRSLVDNKLAIPFAIALGQHRRDSVYGEDITELKILGWLQDNVQQSLLQITEFVASTCDKESYARLVPSVVELCKVYNLEPEVAFHIYRPKLAELFKYTYLITLHRRIDILGKFEAVDTIVPSKVSTVVPRNLYILFWGLSLYDIHVPLNSYKVEIAKQKGILQNLDLDRNEGNIVSTSKRKKDKDRCVALIQQLERESTLQSINFEKIFDKNTLLSLIFSCTEFEAKNYGLFLSNVLSTLGKWHKGRDAYQAEGRGDGLPGFALRWNPGSSSKTSAADLLEYDGFCKAIYKWHSFLFTTFMHSLNSDEYIQIRNAILILDKIRDDFPVIDSNGKELSRAAQKLAETETRQDLKQLGLAYYGRLQTLSKDWISSKAFRNGRDPSIAPLQESDATPKSAPSVTSEAVAPSKTPSMQAPESKSQDSAMHVEKEPGVEVKPLKPNSQPNDRKEDGRRNESEPIKDKKERAEVGTAKKADVVRDSVAPVSRESPRKSRNPQDETMHRTRDRESPQSTAGRLTSRVDDERNEERRHERNDEKMRDSGEKKDQADRRMEEKDRKVDDSKQQLEEKGRIPTQRKEMARDINSSVVDKEREARVGTKDTSKGSSVSLSELTVKGS
ncbi:THO complex subunit 2 [Phlyctochytrium bullatum]|nr:THO complex subunit 2 [Phlyctochytrium bullatum]